MPVTAEYREWVMEQLRPVGSVSGRSMFGGYSLYLDGVIFALMDDDTTYFKVDESNRPDFEAAGTGPFRPFGETGPAMQYYELPADVLEDRERLRDWALRAVEASRKVKRRGRKK